MIYGQFWILNGWWCWLGGGLLLCLPETFKCVLLCLPPSPSLSFMFPPASPPHPLQSSTSSLLSSSSFSSFSSTSSSSSSSFVFPPWIWVYIHTILSWWGLSVSCSFKLLHQKSFFCTHLCIFFCVDFFLQILTPACDINLSISSRLLCDRVVHLAMQISKGGINWSWFSSGHFDRLGGFTAPFS